MGKQTNIIQHKCNNEEVSSRLARDVSENRGTVSQEDYLVLGTGGEQASSRKWHLESESYFIP